MEDQFTRKNFLLVDDDPVSNFLIEKMITSSGLSNFVCKVLNGKEAMDYLSDAQTMPDVILLDINMPVMNGFEFLEAFNRLDESVTSRIVVILLSSSDDTGDRRRARELGVQHYMIKPLRTERLREIILEV